MNETGGSIGNTSDSAHFVYQPLVGDGTVVARVLSLQGGGFYQQAGVMIRETLTPGSTEAFTNYELSVVYLFDRPTTGSGTHYQPASPATVALPYWVKLVRTGNTFTSYSSADGATWSQTAPSLTIIMAQNVYAGLVLSSASSTVATATFDNAYVITPTSPFIAGVSPASGSAGTSVTITGTNFGASQGASTVTFNGTAATPASWSATSITVPVPSGATTGPLLLTVSGMESNVVTFTVTGPPTIASLSPASGAPGTSVTISGANFGTAPGTVTIGGANATVQTWSPTSVVVLVPSSMLSGWAVVQINASGQLSNSVSFMVRGAPRIFTVSSATATPGAQLTIFGVAFGAVAGSVQLGNINGAIVSWSDTQIVAIVAPSAQSGVVQVFQGGLSSNQVALTIVFPATISASASPAPNANGWNNSNVTVTFTCTSGGNTVACLSPQTVSAEGSNQVITGTVADSSGHSLSASITLNIDKTIPALTVASPTEGAAFTTSGVTVSGTVTDALSGVSGVTCNGVAASLSGGSFSCNISLSVGVNLVVVRATDLAGNVAGSNLHLSLAGTLPAPQSLQITPANVNMHVGETQQFTAVDEKGRPRSDATWTISNTTIATISTDSSPILTAVAVGQVTLTASVQGSSIQAQVNILSGTSLAPGTVRWSAPPVPGFTLYTMLQAAPTSANTPDLYSIETGSGTNALIRAFTAEGRQMWQQTISNFSYGPVPDAFGGLLVDTTAGKIDLDGVTGSPVWQSQAKGFTIRNDGTIVSAGYSVFMYDGNSGQQRLEVPLRQSTITNIYTYGLPTHISQAGPASVGTPVAGPDGSVYLVYSTSDVTDVQSRTTVNGENFFSDVVTTIYTLNLLTVSLDGTSQTQQISIATDTPLKPGLAIPDGNGGVLAPWTTPYTNSWPFHVTDVGSNGTTTYDLPLKGYYIDLGNIVIGTNGVAFATDFNNTVAFNVSSGQVQWTYPGSIIEATYGGGVSLFDSLGDVVQLNAQGNAGTPVICAPCLSHRNLSLWIPYGSVGLVSGPNETAEASDFPGLLGNAENQTASPKLNVATFMPSIPATQGRFGTEDKAITDIQSSFSAVTTDRRIYALTGSQPATTVTFIEQNAPSAVDVLGFIGHSSFATDNSTGASEAVGLEFVDNVLIRTPDCSNPGNLLGICFFLDNRTRPDGTSAKIPPCLPGVVDQEVAVEIQSSYDATAIGCYTLPIRLDGTVARRTQVLLTSAKVVFVAACDTGRTFTEWWEMNLNAVPGGRALVVPDIAAMSAMQINQGLTIPTGFIDIQQGAVAWEKLVNSLAKGNTAQQAVDEANAAVDTFYGTITSWPPPIGRLAQVKFKVVGNPNAHAK